MISVNVTHEMMNAVIKKWLKAKSLDLDTLNFPDWLRSEYKCQIRYMYNSTAVEYLIFEDKRDKTWFLLNN